MTTASSRRACTSPRAPSLLITDGTDTSVVKARELSGLPGLLFRRNSVSGAVEAVQRSGSWGGLNAVLHGGQ